MPSSKFLTLAAFLLAASVSLFFFKPDRSPYFLKKKYRLYSYLSKNFKATEVLNFKMFLNPKDEIMTPFIQAYHHWEPLETTILFQNLKAGDVFVDVGANMGYYTIMAALKVGPQGHVFAFEPEPENFEILRQNLILNQISNVTLEKKAVANRSGKMKLYLAEKNKGDHSLRPNEPNRNFIEVEAVSLDEYFQKQKVDFIKIDVQGADGLVIEGSSQVLSNNPEILLVTEFNTYALRSLQTDPAGLLESLHQKNFVFYNINESTGSLEKISASEILERYDLPQKETNILLAPKGRNINSQ